MSERNVVQQAPGVQSSLQNTLENMKTPFVQAMQVIDHKIPNYQTPDAMGVSLARRTPQIMAICAAVLLASVIGSLLHIGSADFLWGIPSLIAVSLGVGCWIWSSSLLLRPDLSDEARATVKRAMRLHWGMVIAGLLTTVYFVGMGMGAW